MKKLITGILMATSAAVSVNLNAQTTVNIMDSVVFYDGYASVVSEPTPAGVTRFRNDLVTKKITAQDLDAVGNELTINVTISALCDNYDRIGNVNLALVPHGATSYNPDSVARIEIGRFITPFMNKNIQPTSVPYTFSVYNLAKILKSSEITSNYDFWLELQVFGVPYAANTQVSGCSGRNDVFMGKVDFVSNGPISSYDPATVLLPLSFQADFNNYQSNATDSVGTTVRTIPFTTTETVYDARFYLITSNHGSGTNGEEYVRRQHYVYFDGNQVLTYLPNGKSCEPYRQYNTQSNGIYGTSAHSESWWTSWNNWCPGDTIAIREIMLGDLPAGTHTFQIAVPDAVFYGQSGNFPLSLYMQGSKTDVLGVETLNNAGFSIYPNPAINTLTVKTEKEASSFEILDASGKKVKTELTSPINLQGLDSGVYFIQVRFTDGMLSRQRFVIQ